jgi:hypothetical protein
VIKVIKELIWVECSPLAEPASALIWPLMQRLFAAPILPQEHWEVMMDHIFTYGQIWFNYFVVAFLLSSKKQIMSRGQLTDVTTLTGVDFKKVIKLAAQLRQQYGQAFRFPALTTSQVELDGGQYKPFTAYPYQTMQFVEALRQPTEQISESD